MNRYTEHAASGYERLVRCDNDNVGFRAWIAIHSTSLGPALGGCRLWNYIKEDDAVTDVLRLSRGMTYKNSLAELALGGGKAVIHADPAQINRKQLFQEFGTFVETLGGEYITAEDVNSTLADMEIVKSRTQHVATVGASGNPSPFTAFGVYYAIKVAARQKLQRENLEGLRIAVQGAGETGGRLAELLYKDGCELLVCDINKANLKKLSEKIVFKQVNPEKIYSLDCDIFSPCALGGILNKVTIPLLRCEIIAGSANNQLLEDDDGNFLHERGILYSPDFAINAGGVINISCEIGQTYDSMKAKQLTAEIGDRLGTIISLSKQHNLPTNIIANRLAEKRFRAGTLRQQKAKAA